MPEEKFEEVQEEFFNIIGNIKLLLKEEDYPKVKEYVDEQYEILKKELFPDYQSEKQFQEKTK